jgi:hypothetical protein
MNKSLTFFSTNNALKIDWLTVMEVVTIVPTMMKDIMSILKRTKTPAG